MNLISKETRYDSNETLDRKKRYFQIIDILEEYQTEYEGMTAKEIARIMYSKGYSTSDERNITAPRLTELLEMNLVKVIGKRKCFYSNKKVSVYKLTQKGEIPILDIKKGKIINT